MTPREELIYRRPKLNVRAPLVVSRATLKAGGQSWQVGQVLPRRKLGWDDRMVRVLYEQGTVDTLTRDEWRRLYGHLHDKAA